MESQKLKGNDSKIYGGGRQKTHDYPQGGILYHVNRVANITGYRRSDVEIVLKCLAQVFDECLVEVAESPNKAFIFGPIEIFGRKVNKNGYWKNPKTGELVKLVPHVKPAVKLRSKWREAFTNQQALKRKELNIDINGEPL